MVLELVRSMPPRRVRIVRRVAVIAAVLVVAILAVPLVLVLNPEPDAPGRSDAVLVLGPATPARVTLGEELVASGAAKTLVVSENPSVWVRPVAACTEKRSYDVECFIPYPATTQGEAEEFRRLADKHGWKSVQVITYAPHINRTRLVVQRCFPGDVRVLDAPRDPVGPTDIVHHVAGWLKMVVEGGDC